MVTEPARRLAALSILGGPLHGRRHDLDEVVAEVLIGSDADCHLHVDLPSISPIHARLWTDLNGAVAHDTHAPRGLYVNTRRVEGEAPVTEGDVLWLGPPQESGSVCIRCHFEAWVEILPAAPQTESGLPAARPGAAGPAAERTDPIPPEAQEPILLDEGDMASTSKADPESTVAFLGGEEPAPVEAGPRPQQASPPGAEAVESPGAPVRPDEAAVEPPATPAPAYGPGPAPALATPSTASPVPEEDPFFVSDGAGPASTDEVVEAPPAAVPSPLEGDSDTPLPVAADDDWIIADAAPVAESPNAASRPSPGGPAPSGPPDDAFFIAEEAVGRERDTAEPVPPSAVAMPPSAVPSSLPPPTPPGPPTPAAPPSTQGADRAPRPPSEGRSSDTTPRPSASPGRTAPAAGPATNPSARPLAAGESAPRAATPSAPPAARRPIASPRAQTAVAGARRAPAARRARPRSRSGGGLPRFVSAVVGLALVGALGIGAWQWFGRSVELSDVAPSRVRVGQRVTLTGRGFSSDPAGNAVLFGTQPARVLQASSTRLEVEVPEAVAEAGAERKVPVIVKRGRLESPPVEVSVFQGPRLHGISPDVAMPGEEVLLAGAGWGIGATVRFGDVPATVVAAEPTQIRVVVPPLPGGSGTSAPVVVSVGGIESNPAPFFVGRLPLVTAVDPPAVSAGDVVTVSGRGFARDPTADDVRVSGRRALVVSATTEELKIVAPLVSRSEEPMLEVRVPGSPEVGRAALHVAPSADPLTLHFVAEPFPGPPDRPHAVLATDLGPTFVLAASGARSAAERALEAEQRLNQAAAALAASPGLAPEVRDLTSQPTIALTGRPEALLEVTAEDAAAYGEDWTRLRGRGGAVTPARLARWWEAVLNDLVLMLVRNERPRFAAALAPEGRVLQEVFDAARRGGGPGVRHDVVTGAGPRVGDALRLLALRVPASVRAEVPAAVPGAPPPAATPVPQKAAPLQLDGTWAGSETEGGQRRFLSVRFRRGSGSISYEGGLTLTLPFLGFEQPGRDRVRFTVEFHGGLRHYLGHWDGETLSGDIARDEAGRTVVGHFELRPRQ
jgi:FHA domain/IPT/TIG domain